MEYFSLNSAKSFLGKNVNLHLKDGAVIVNVQLTAISKRESGKNCLLEYATYGKRKITRIPIRSVAWAEMLNRNLIQTGSLKIFAGLDKS
jgi:hypothetical protein